MDVHPLEIVDRHLLVRLEGGLALVDTGSPFDIGRGRATALASEPWSPPRTHVSVLDVAEEHLGVGLEWLIGQPSLSRCRMLLDWRGRTARLSRAPIALPGAARLPIDLALPVPFIGFTPLADPTLLCRAVLDSGAALSYVPARAVAGSAPIRTERDFHPTIGAFSTDVWELPILVGDRAITLEAGVLPSSLAALTRASGGWIIGSDFFRDRTIVLDYPNALVLDAA